MTTDLSKYDVNQLPGADVLARQRYAIVVADWNSEITYAMAQGAVDTFLKHGVQADNIDLITILKINAVRTNTVRSVLLGAYRHRHTQQHNHHECQYENPVPCFTSISFHPYYF